MTTSSPSSAPLVLADGRAVEQRLRRVLVRAVARVDHARPQARGEHLGGARLRVAHHHHVGGHRVEVPRRVEQRLALDGRRRRARDVDRVGRQPLGRDLERRARAGRRLEEQVDDRLAPQRRHLLDGPLVDLQEPVAEIEQHGDLRGGERLHPQQVPVREPAHAAPLPQDHPVPLAPLGQHHAHRFAGRGLDGDADDVGLNRQLAPAAIDQRRQLDRARPAVVGQHVHRRADRAAGEEHVVHQDDCPPVDRLGQLGGADLRLGQAAKDVVAVERDVDRAQERPRLARLGQQARRGAGPGRRRRSARRRDRAAAPPAGSARRAPAPCAAASARDRPRRESHGAR